MRIQRAKAHLSNGDVVELEVQTEDVRDWFGSVITSGIKTRDKYIPHHSIVYILIEPEENDIVLETKYEIETHEGVN